jgi:Pirin C-terminal cupin domain
MRAVERSAVMVLGGEPLGERFVYWNFVSSSKDRLAQAAADWKAGRMELPDGDDAEFTPLPDDRELISEPRMHAGGSDA